MYKSRFKKNRQNKTSFSRIRLTSGLIFLVGLAVIARLFILMVMQHDFYTALAKGSHEVYSNLIPDRGKIFLQDSRTSEKYPAAINRDYFLVYADTRDIENDKKAEKIGTELEKVFSFEKEEKEEVVNKLKKDNDPYEPIREKVLESKVNQIKQKDLPGISFIRKSYRYYPEEDLAGPVLGFVGRNKEGKKGGKYGVEGYWNSELSGSGGFLEGIKSATGLWIPTLKGEVKDPKDGANITLTLDRTVQFKACQKLRKAMKKYKAEKASLVIMNPDTGAIRAMCSLPDFNPNKYSKVSSIGQYNNSTIFTPYEIGSIFKPVVMAAAINEDKVNPSTPFDDSGQVEGLCSKPIRNSNLKEYDRTDMTGVLEKSINTGMVYVARQLGKHNMVDYIESFGFGTKTGIGLNTEVAGTIDSLYKKSGNDIGCYAATASFGQGITATPLQMAVAYSAIANGGKLIKPYIVEKVEYPNGKVEETDPETIKRVLKERTTSLLGGMLVSVVDKGHAGTAGVNGYYVAGKTGTAQISGEGGYTEATNHSFVGFAPIDDPKFVTLVKFHKPERDFSASTAAPVFGDISKFLLDYYQVPPGREK